MSSEVSNGKIRYLVTLFTIIFFQSIYSQSTITIREICEEDCSNGVDDDNDGLADCEDRDCIDFLKSQYLLKSNDDSTLCLLNVIQDSILTWGDCIDIINAGIINTSAISLDSIVCIRYDPMDSSCGLPVESCSSTLLCPDNDCGDYFVSLIGRNDRLLISEVVHVTKKEVTFELLDCVFSETDSVRLLEIIDIFNKYHDQFEINTPIRIAHFLAQVGYETNMFTEIEIESSCFTRGNSYGWSIWANNRWDNSLIRGCSDVTEATEVEDFRNAIFRVPLDSIPCEYVCNCHEDEVSNLQAQMNLFNYGRRCMQGHGDENSGDGWNYRGRGLVQLTWKSNYIEFNEWLAENTILNVDVVNNPDLVGTNMEIAILSALWYWESKDVNQSADMNDIDMITQLINGSNTHIDAREEIFDSTLT